MSQKYCVSVTMYIEDHGQFMIFVRAQLFLVITFRIFQCSFYGVLAMQMKKILLLFETHSKAIFFYSLDYISF